MGIFQLIYQLIEINKMRPDEELKIDFSCFRAD